MNTWQLGKLNKFKLKESDIKVVNMAFITIPDGKKTHKEFHGFKHYMCSCGQYELLGFIDKLNGKCRDCSGFVTSK